MFGHVLPSNINCGSLVWINKSWSINQGDYITPNSDNLSNGLTLAQLVNFIQTPGLFAKRICLTNFQETRTARLAGTPEPDVVAGMHNTRTHKNMKQNVLSLICPDIVVLGNPQWLVDLRVQDCWQMTFGQLNQGLEFDCPAHQQALQIQTWFGCVHSRALRFLWRLVLEEAISDDASEVLGTSGAGRCLCTSTGQTMATGKGCVAKGNIN